MDRKLVLIEWLDSKGVTSDWEFLGELKPMPPDSITSVGFVLESNEEYVTIAQSFSKDQVLGRMTIPQCCVKRLVELDYG